MVQHMGSLAWIDSAHNSNFRRSLMTLPLYSRTGVGKSQTSRYVAEYYKKKGLKVAAIRHPMVRFPRLIKNVSAVFGCLVAFVSQSSYVFLSSSREIIT